MDPVRRGTGRRMDRPLAAFVVVLALAGGLDGCATPQERVEHLARTAGFDRQVVAGEPFEHLVFVRHGGRTGADFNVYIEGDGTPWLTRYRVSEDPTPRRPLMLELMRLDPGPALYLGRPCYFGLMNHCRAGHWTSDRYAETVVASMAAALREIRRELGWHGQPVLIGHSGGGALAMLLAPRVPDTRAVLTLAGNLDIDAWTDLHEYSPLAGSLNPAEAAPLPARIRQLHIVGGEDQSVPPHITRAGLAPQQNAEVLRFPGQAHHCCWRELWPSILGRL